MSEITPETTEQAGGWVSLVGHDIYADFEATKGDMNVLTSKTEAEGFTTTAAAGDMANHLDRHVSALWKRWERLGDAIVTASRNHKNNDVDQAERIRKLGDAMPPID